ITTTITPTAHRIVGRTHAGGVFGSSVTTATTSGAAGVGSAGSDTSSMSISPGSGRNHPQTRETPITAPSATRARFHQLPWLPSSVVTGPYLRVRLGQARPLAFECLRPPRPNAASRPRGTRGILPERRPDGGPDSRHERRRTTQSGTRRPGAPRREARGRTGTAPSDRDRLHDGVPGPRDPLVRGRGAGDVGAPNLARHRPVRGDGRSARARRRRPGVPGPHRDRGGLHGAACAGPAGGGPATT